MISWAQFKVNFEGKESKAFEDLAYLLFCSKYNIEDGLFRYVNQKGIETNPIEFDGECIGFQAKFFRGRISENKDKLIDSIKKAKSSFPKLSKIVFYINQDFTQSTKKNTNKPIALLDIEKVANENKVKIEWVLKSHLERILADPENKWIYDQFFGKEKSILDFIRELEDYSKLLFDSIKNQINYNDEYIKINRELYMEDFATKLSYNDLLLVSGDSGCGKSSLVKDFYLLKKCPFLMFKAEDLDYKDIQSFFKRFNLTLKDFNDFYSEFDEKYILIDSAERLGFLTYQNTYKEFLESMKKNNWKIILTSRNIYSNILKLTLKSFFEFKIDELNVTNLSLEELEDLAIKFKFNLPRSGKLKKSLRNLFYLNLYILYSEDIDINDENNFNEIFWELIIKKSYNQKNNMHKKREDCFLEFIHKRSENPYFKFDITYLCSEILNELEKDEIIKLNHRNNSYFVTHDIYEEWALERLINNAFLESMGNYEEFFKLIGNSSKIRFAFRNWILNYFNNDFTYIEGLLDFIIFDNDGERIWLDEIIFAVLNSTYLKDFLEKYSLRLFEDNYIIYKFCYGLKTFFIVEEDTIFSKVVKDSLNYKIIKPFGHQWSIFISFLYHNIDKIDYPILEIILPILSCWNNSFDISRTTKYSSLIGLHFFEELDKTNNLNYRELKSKLVPIILSGSKEIEEELSIILNKIIKNEWKFHSDPYYDLSEAILGHKHFIICEVVPELVLDLAALFWFDDGKKEEAYRISFRIEPPFLIDENNSSEYYASAFETPIFPLLKFEPEKTLEFIIDFVNKSIGNYAKNISKNLVEDESFKEITLTIDGKENKQYISNSLWQCYRGTGSPVMPNLLKVIHMALEKFLLQECEKNFSDDFELILKKILYESKSASLTAVVASIVMAFPDKLFDIFLILFNTLDLFIFDNLRCFEEYQAGSLYKLASYRRDPILINERMRTCNQKFRKNNFEYLLIYYQYFNVGGISAEIIENRINQIQEIIDNKKKEIADSNISDEEKENYNILLSRIDRRNLTPVFKENDDGSFLIKFENKNLDINREELLKGSLEKSNVNFRYFHLKSWADLKIKNENISDDLLVYDENPNLVIDDLKDLCEDLKDCEDIFYSFNIGIPVTVSICLLTFYSDSLKNEDKELCKEIILEMVCLLFDEGYCYQISHNLDKAVNTLPLLIDLFPNQKDDFSSLLLLILLNDGKAYGNQYFSNFAINSLKKLNDSHPDLVDNILCCYSIYKPKFKEIINEVHRKNINYNFQKTFADSIMIFLETYNDNSENLEDFINLNTDDLDLNSLNVIFQCIPHNSKKELHLEYFKSIFPIFSQQLFDRNSELNDSRNFFVRHSFLNNFTKIILSNVKYIEKYSKTFLDLFEMGDNACDLLDYFVRNSVELKCYDEFWKVWFYFYKKVTEKQEKSNNYYLSKLFSIYILNYQFYDGINVNNNIKNLEIQFYRKICVNFGQYDFVLNEISKIINIDKFFEHGLKWLKIILTNNSFKKKIDKSTIKNLENFVKRYISINEEKIIKNLALRKDLKKIISFMINNDSSEIYTYYEWLVSLN